MWHRENRIVRELAAKELITLIHLSLYKVRRVKGATNFLLSGLKIVKRIRRRKYQPVIIERTIDLLPGPFTALLMSFLGRSALTNKAMWNI